MKRLQLVSSLAAAALMMACGGSGAEPEVPEAEGPAESAGESVDEAASDAEDWGDEAVDDVEDAADEATDDEAME